MRFVCRRYILVAAEGDHVVEMPMDSEVLSARELADEIAIYARVPEAEQRIEKRLITIVGQNRPAPLTAFLGTCVFGHAASRKELQVFIRANGTRQVPR